MSETTPWELTAIDRGSDGRYYPVLMRLVNGRRKFEFLRGHPTEGDAVESASEWVKAQEQNDEPVER
jgi:hypothetical protein